LVGTPAIDGEMAFSLAQAHVLKAVDLNDHNDQARFERILYEAIQ
jgi:hypothetical protein